MAKYKLSKLEFKSFCVGKDDIDWLYERYRYFVTGILRNIYPNISDADILESYDLAMLTLYNKASEISFEEEKSLTNYLVSIALKKLTDIHRKQKRYHGHIILLDSPWEGDWTGVGKDEMTSSEKEMQDGVYEIIKNMEPPCCDVISLRYYECIKWEVIAEMIDGKKSSKQIFYWNKKCLNLLKALLLERCPELCEYYC